LQWQGAPLSWQTETDDKGEFDWDSGPDEPVQFSFSKAGFQETQMDLEPREKKTVQLGRMFQLSGKVLDADTGEPIKNFTIVNGRVWGIGDDEPVHWDQGNDRRGSNGAYTFGGDRQDFGAKAKIMVRAEGYLPAESPLFEPRGWHEHNFKLQKGSGPAGVVLDANGREVEGAEVAVLGAGYVAVGTNGMKQFGQRGSNIAKTDAQGRFSLPALLNNPTIIAVHTNGFALLEKTKPGQDLVLLLKPWGRIEGVAKTGTKPAAKISVMIAPKQGLTSLLNYDFEMFRTTTGDDGRFNFDRVPAVASQLVRLTPMGGNGWRWNDQTPIDVKPGQTTRVTFGGAGRPVIGKLTSSQPGQEVDWSSADSYFSTKFPRPPRNIKSQEEIQAWSNSPEVKKARENHRSYGVEMNADGTFRMDNVAPGEYTLTVNLREPGRDQFSGRMLGSLQHDVVVPEIPGGVSDEPLDLGALAIQLNNTLKIGDMAPDFETAALEGNSIKLSSFRGKFVLLDFWATWCGPCVSEIPELKLAHESLSKDEKFVLISLSLDPEKKDPIEFTKKRGMNWTHGYLGDWSEDKVTKSYGVTGIPAMFLIGPDGRIVARDFRAPNARATVEQAMVKKTSERN
jgi:peroxiredoxin